MKELTTAEKTAARIKRRTRRRTVSVILLLVSVLLVGGSLIALLLLLHTNGKLAEILTVISDVVFENEFFRTLFIFWMLAVPLILIILLVINILRRRQFGYYHRTWADVAQLALGADRKAAAAEAAKKEKKNRFSRLNEMMPRDDAPKEGAVRSLAELCEKFRVFAAADLHLYYTEAQIREFIAGLAVSRILILQGMSGTGKTSLAYAFGEFLGNSSSIVPVQPMWKERSDLLGYYNEFTKKYNETPLLRKMYEANGSGQIYLTVLDEMNIARVEYYFAEFLSLLEIPDPELRYLEVVSDKWEDDPKGLKEGRIKLPENMWFIGTANNDDSTFSISDKVYDRAMIVDLDVRAVPFGGTEPVPSVPVSYAEFNRLSENAQKGYELTRRNERRLAKLDAFFADRFRISFGNRIMRQIRSYISVYASCGGGELEALDDILCKKVLRKLAYQDLSMRKGDLDEASKYLETLFGEESMPKCRAYLARIGK